MTPGTKPAPEVVRESRLPSREQGYITVCAWCPELHILSRHVLPNETLYILIGPDGEYSAHACVMGRALQTLRTLEFSHGICEDCRARHFPVLEVAKNSTEKAGA